MTLAGGVVAGLVLAFGIEFVLDRSVRRVSEIERKLKLPLFISIPDCNYNGHRMPRIGSGKQLALERPEATSITLATEGAGAELAPWDPGHTLHPFYEGLRDRLIVNFELRNLMHKPKLVAVTSCNKGAGVSTIAAGLAASLSETGDGNV